MIRLIVKTIAPFVITILLFLIEAIMHYNTGVLKGKDNTNMLEKLKPPPFGDFVKIITIGAIFYIINFAVAFIFNLIP